METIIDVISEMTKEFDMCSADGRIGRDIMVWLSNGRETIQVEEWPKCFRVSGYNYATEKHFEFKQEGKAGKKAFNSFLNAHSKNKNGCELGSSDFNMRWENR